MTSNIIIGNYTAQTKEDKKAMEKEFVGRWRENVVAHYDELSSGENSVFIGLDTKIDTANAAVGLGAMITFLGLYIGLVFLIACGAILALKELSESVDSIGRYEMLRKLGVEERDISKSLFIQTGIFFLLPMLLACVHSVFGMKFSLNSLELFGTAGLGKSVLATVAIILLIYGGYFLVTYFCGRGIVKGKR